MKFISRQILAAGLAASLAAPVMAQRASSPAPAPRSDAKSTTNINTIGDDGVSVQLTIRDDEVTAFVNGEPVPQDRIERDDKAIRILGEDGKVIKEFLVSKGGSGGVWTTGSGDKRQNQFVMKMESEPRAFMGVMLGEVDETTAAQLGLDPAQVVTITSVTEGLAADKAGLKAHDIVVMVQGADGASGEALRGALSKKKPGEAIEIEVLRGGKRQSLTVTLGEAPAANEFAFAPEGLAEWNLALDDGGAWAMSMDELHSQLDKGRAAWEKAMAQLEEQWDSLDLTLTDADREKLETALAHVRESLEGMEMDIELPRVRFFGNGDRRAVVVPAPPAPPAPTAAPAPGTARAPAGTYRFIPGNAATEATDERLKNIEERMNRIEELLQKLAEKN